MSIQKATPLGKFIPCETSAHYKRTKTVYRGICSRTGKSVHFYEKDGRRFVIDAAEFPLWRKDFRNSGQ